MISIGSTAPVWNATAYQNGEVVTLSSDDYKGTWVLMYFWPFDGTAICHSEVSGFQSLESEFDALGVALVGVSCDSTESHKEWFTDIEAFPKGEPKHAALSDESRQITKDFGFHFEPANCSVRGTVLIDPNGVVQSFGANFLSVARDPKDVLITARAFTSGQSCSLEQRG